MSMRRVCGVDGCRGGWIAVFKDLDFGLTSPQFFRTAEGLFHVEPPPLVFAIDIPIGLPELGPRLCDLQARHLLGPVRGRSVFSAPIRPILLATDYEQASEMRYALEGLKMSRQTWGIVPKIKEVDAVLREAPDLRGATHEVHPEVCFFVMAGRRPLRYGKKTRSGKAQRLDLLTVHFGPSVASALARRPQFHCAEDDLIDAFAALWTAQRILAGLSETLPAVPPHDQYGLPMQIVV
jgi:predicted RNase H-like nuclease